MPRADPRSAPLEAWLRANGAPALVPNRSALHAMSSPFVGSTLLVGYMLRTLAHTVTRRGNVMLQVVPLLLVALTLSFFSTEVWQTIGRLHGLPLVLTTLLFVALAAAFANRQAPPDLEALARFSDSAELRAALPSRLAGIPISDAQAPAPRLRRRERANLVVISVLSQIVVAAVIAVIVAAFFIVLGVLTVDRAAVVSWIGHGPSVVGAWRIAGHEYLLSNELLRVSAFLGAFTGFYFIVSSTTDVALRTELASVHERHLRNCLAVRQAYWSLKTS